MMSSLRWVQDMMTSDDKVGGWVKKGQNHDDVILEWSLTQITDYGRPERKEPSLHGRKFTPTPKFLVTAEAYSVYHIG